MIETISMIKFGIVFVILIILSILDYKHKQVPSVLTTGLILITLLLSNSFQNIYFAMVMLVMGIALYEFDYFKGIADIKCFVVIGLTMASIIHLIAFIVALVGLSILLQAFLKISKKEVKEMPYIPLITASYFIYLAYIFNVLI